MKYIVIIILLLVLLLSINYNLRKNENFEEKKKGSILMYCTPNLLDKWARHSIYLNRKYAEKHGYEFFLISQPYDDTVTHAWQKIPAMKEILNKNFDFVMYIDTDAIFNKHDITIESIIEKYNGDILICSDESNSGGLYKTNGGTVIAKNTDKSLYLLDKWWDLRHRYKDFAFEQWAISDIYQKKIHDIDSSMIVVAPENEFNSVFGDVLNYSNNIETSSPPDIFVLHFMSMDDEKREKTLSKLVEIYNKNNHQDGFITYL
jgi:hypothetical protein